MTTSAPEIVTITAFGRAYRIHNPGAGRVGSKLAHGEPYERKLLVDCHQQHFTGVAFDVGAHIGNHSLYLAAICGLKVHAFECHPPTVTRLRENLALNPGIDVTVHEWAAGAAEGTGHLTAGRWVEFDPTREDNGSLTPGGEITVHAIDDMLDVDDLAVVKIDVEGNEPAVLTGMARHLGSCHPTVYTECHTLEAHDAVAAVLEPFGYQMTRGIAMGSRMERWQ